MFPKTEWQRALSEAHFQSGVYGPTAISSAPWTTLLGRAHPGPSTDPVIDVIDTLRAFSIKRATEKREEFEPMEHLYHVAVVTKKRQILLDKKVVAENEDGAKFEADVSAVIKKAGLRPPGVTVLVNDLGPVKVEREPEKVRIVKDDTDSAPPNNA